MSEENSSDIILSGLNKEQREAVEATEGYVCVIAGAGTGKTRALTHRYAYIIKELGISPANILCLTFTNKAAGEMKKRVRQLLGGEYDTSFVSTIHSFCVRILREDIGKLFYPESFVVLDNSDQKKILEEVYDELGLKMDTASFQHMIEKIRYYKNYLHYLDYITEPNVDFSEFKPKNTEETIIIRYIEKQKKYFGLDFFDLINFSIFLFRKYPDVLEKWQKRLHYIQVDEFQDTTSKEFKFIRSLTEKNKNWFVVGDPDQTIYEWRGAKLDLLLDFDKQFTPCKTIIMSKNYRSAPEILNAANSLIEKNQHRIKKELYTSRASGELPEHYHGQNEEQEIGFIISKIKKHMENGGKYSDIAVLYRSNYVSRFIEQGLLKENIPYIIYGGVGFYERAEIKDVLSYMRLVAQGDDLSFLRIVNVPRRKIGKSKLNYIKAKAEAAGSTLYEALKANINDDIFRGSGAKKFVGAVERLKQLADAMPVSELLQRLLIETDYELYLRENGDMERLDNVSELLRSIVIQEQDYGEHFPLDTFLQNVSLLKDVDEETDGSKDKVKLMTIHTAKGLEFDTVFIAGMSESIFPSMRSLEERHLEALEEERRLCFVAMTRARKRLYMTECEGFNTKGNTKLPSRFLFDIEKDKLKRSGKIPEELIFEYDEKIYSAEKTESFEIGRHIKHKVFGEGVIEEKDDDTKTYMIRFLHGIKPISYDYKGLSDNE